MEYRGSMTADCAILGHDGSQAVASLAATHKNTVMWPRTVCLEKSKKESSPWNLSRSAGDKVRGGCRFVLKIAYTSHFWTEPWPLRLHPNADNKEAQLKFEFLMASGLHEMKVSKGYPTVSVEVHNPPPTTRGLTYLGCF